MATRAERDRARVAKAFPRRRKRVREAQALGVRHEVLVASGFYLLTLTLLLFRIESHPGYAYNWEHYTAWHMLAQGEHLSLGLFGVDDGLMTDSGRSPLIVLPVRAAFAMGLEGLAALRVPIVLISAAAVPLLWLVGRRLVGEAPARIAALLLAVSPVFLLYGRTATTVGLSLVPALLTVYVLHRLLTEKWRWGWLVALQALLVGSSYAYAPIRILWPMSLALFAAGIWYRRDRTQRFLLAGVVTALTLPLFLTLVHDPVDPDPQAAVAGYYNARGEHILDIGIAQTRFPIYLEDDSPRLSKSELVSRLLTKNARDLLYLVLDYDTRPAITNFWNPHGRFIPVILLPFLVLGMVKMTWSLRFRVEHGITLALLIGLTAPMLLTSKVHVGRLIFVLPIVFLVIAYGITVAVAQLRARLDRRMPGPPGAARAVTLLSPALVLIVAWSTYVDFYRTEPSATRESDTETLILSLWNDAREHGGIVLLTVEPKTSRHPDLLASTLRLTLEDEFQFVDVSRQPDSLADAGGLPRLYHGVRIEQLRNPTVIPGGCETIYVVQQSIESLFKDAVSDWHGICGHTPTVVWLTH